MSHFFTSLLNLFAGWSYGGIIALMAIESSFIPFPSEVIIPPAGYLASQGRMNLWLVIFSGILGSLIGALFNYYLAKHLGSPIIHRLARSRWAKWFLISPESLTKSEQFFRSKGDISTFIGRFLPAIRQLISIPAGLAKMDLKSFLFYTALGSGLWCVILALLGYWFGANQNQLQKYYNEISYSFLSLFLLSLLIWLIKRHYAHKEGKTKID